MENRKKKPDAFIVDQIDNGGMKIERIYYKSLTHVIYRTSNSLRLEIDDGCPERKEYEERHYKLGVDLARIYSWLPENLSWSEPINRQIARAIAVNIAGKNEDAQKMLKHAEERIVKLRTIQGRLEYTLSSFTIIFFILIILNTSIFLNLETCALYSQISLFGAIGGGLSVAIGYSSLNIDLDANTKTNCMIGASRILIAVSASIFIYFAVKTDIVFSFINESSSKNEGIFLIAMVAGFCELLVPNIMNNLSNKSEYQGI